MKKAIQTETTEQKTGETRVDVAGQWQLMWWRFRKHKLALASGILVILIYLVAVFAEFLAPYSSGYYVAEYKNRSYTRPELYFRLGGSYAKGYFRHYP